MDQVEEEHFGPSGDMEVLCRATVSAVYTDQGSPEAMPVVLEHREDLIRGKKRYSLLKKHARNFDFQRTVERKFQQMSRDDMKIC